MHTDNKNLDKAGLEHWNNTENNVKVSLDPFSPTPGVRGFGRRLWHEMFKRAFSTQKNNRELLELGCGGSTFLPYFYKTHKFKISGIDYSESGIEITKNLCESNGVRPTLYCVDFFQAPQECAERYDAVVSFGVVEHFTDTQATIKAFTKFVRPGGCLLTVVPNMKGLCGLGQRIIAKEIYEMHEVIGLDRLRLAHESAGLRIKSCEYFMFSNFGVINPGSQSGQVKRMLFKALQSITGISWLIESVTRQLKPNRFTSPYLICIAEKPMV